MHRNSDTLESDSTSVVSNAQPENGGEVSLRVEHKPCEDQENHSSISQVATPPASSTQTPTHTHPITSIDETAVAASGDSSKTNGHDGTTDLPDPVTPSPSTRHRPTRRSGSVASVLSLDSMKEGRGIKIGAAKPTISSSSDEGRRYAQLNV